MHPPSFQLFMLLATKTLLCRGFHAPKAAVARGFHISGYDQDAWGGGGGESGTQWDDVPKRSWDETASSGGGRGRGERGSGRGRGGRGSERGGGGRGGDGGGGWGGGGGRFGANERGPSLKLSEAFVGAEFLYGAAPVLNALLEQRRPKFVELLVQERAGSAPASASLAADLAEIQRLAGWLGVPSRSVSKHDLNMLSENRPHQGVVLAVAPIELDTLDALPPPPKDNGVAPCWLALDEVVDPQNLGALIRSASFLGAAGVVVCSKNSAALSPVSGQLQCFLNLIQKP
jgi:21S rRNA (GM2251-2'-O)-methyltransferase